MFKRESRVLNVGVMYKINVFKTFALLGNDQEIEKKSTCRRNEIIDCNV